MSAADRICSLLRKAGPLPTKEIATILGLPKQTATDALHMLENIDRVHRLPEDTGKRFGQRWTLTFRSESSPKRVRNESEKPDSKPDSGSSSSRVNNPPTPLPETSPVESTPDLSRWTPTYIVGMSGTRMWRDPDGFLVSTRNMTPELKAALGINEENEARHNVDEMRDRLRRLREMRGDP